MNIEKFAHLLLILVLTLISGWGDSRGFVFASKIWNEGKLVYYELIKSGLGFFLGISTYWLAIKYLQKFGIVSAEMQTLGWFGVTIVGVALSSGDFFKWRSLEQIIAISVLFGIGWLLVKTSS